MKKVIVILLIVGLLAAIWHSGYFRSDREKIEDRMDSFLEAYNAGDMYAVLKSMDAKTRNTYRAYMNVGNALIDMTGFGIDVSDLFALGISLSDGQTLEFEDMDIEFLSKMKASVTVTMHYREYQDTYTQRVSFTLIKENNDWYICG